MYITRFPSENVYFSRFSMAVFWWKSSLLFWKRFWTLGESARSDPNDSSYIKTLYFYSVHTLLTGVVSKDIISGFRTSCFQSSQLAHPVPLVQHLWIKTPEQLDQSSGWHHHIWGKMRTKKKNTFCICTHRQQSLLSVLQKNREKTKKDVQSLTLVFMGLVLGQVLQQVFIDGEWTAGRHFFDGVDA